MNKRSVRILRFFLLLLLLISFVLNFMAASVSAAPVYGPSFVDPFIRPYFTFFDGSNEIRFDLFQTFSKDKVYQQFYEVDYTFSGANINAKNFNYYYRYHPFMDDDPISLSYESLYTLNCIYGVSGFYMDVSDFYLFGIVSDLDYSYSNPYPRYSFYNGFSLGFLMNVPDLNSTTDTSFGSDWRRSLQYVSGGFIVSVDYYTLGSSEKKHFSFNTLDLDSYSYPVDPGCVYFNYFFLPEYEELLTTDKVFNFTDYFYPIDGTDLFYNGVYVERLTIQPDLDNFSLSGYTTYHPDYLNDRFCLLVENTELVDYPTYIMRDIDVNTFPEDALIDDRVFQDYTKWMGTAVDGFLQLEIAPNFSLGGIFLVLISSLLALFFLKLFAGG